MRFAGAGCPAASVSSGSAAEQDDHIPRQRSLPDHIGGRRRTEHRTDLHPLGDIAGMIQLMNKTRRKTDLVAVGTVSVGRRHGQLALREFSLQRQLRRNQRVARAGDAHRLIDIGSAAEGIADRSAKTRRGTAERFDFRRVVMGFVLEHQKPFLKASVDFGINANGTGIDLFALIEVLKFPRFLQRLG